MDFLIWFFIGMATYVVLQLGVLAANCVIYGWRYWNRPR